MDGLIAVVTGAGGGIGSCTAELLASRGVRVAVADISEGAGQAVVDRIVTSGGEAFFQEFDARDPESIGALFDTTVARYGGLDILHNNAAGTHLYDGDTAVVEIDPFHWDSIIQLNLRGVMLGCKYAVPHMVRCGGGSIVNMSSTRALAGALDLAAYGASKAGVESLTRYVATAYGKQGVRCNAIRPGLIQTPQSVALHGDDDGAAKLLRHVLLPYAGRPDDIAQLVAFLGSAASRYITAQTITVDGGMLSHQPFYADAVDAGRTSV
ncbi:short-chain dehydrogenase (plasmid) [Pseudonocardia sp. EC080610-09]|uniref:SDR family NAD(P)-dependent oxidoreductase n=1 Tax=unclassified Pseudonocardia TaxID=2619320 RepID=UPI00070620B9|nr:MULTISPECIES: SDR family NAD(P)-dependent oxidoreductase [unclassified Pseudonocardia]ALL79793.1 short-chain dehydrogenase [Pseudonocardia sp. EC080610-09]ALL85712.1 short-chain dehydrogenase [Pseudonocardia sp. EC080619-01]